MPSPTVDPTTVQRILDLPLAKPIWDESVRTVHDYLILLLSTAWSEGTGYRGKYSMGDSDWQYTLYVPLIKAGLVTGSIDPDDGYVLHCDTFAADELILAAIASLKARSPFAEPTVARWARAKDAHRCPTCSSQVNVGDFVAVLDTVPETTCCADCIEDDEPPVTQVIVTGASDDLIDIAGDLSAEYSFLRDSDGGVLAFSDGTVLQVRRPESDSCWRINAIALGSGHLHIDPTAGDDGTDTATLTGDIRWVVRGTEFTRASKR